MSSSGYVKFFSLEKGFGFILTEDGREIFVHVSQVKGNPLLTMDNVKFDIVERGDKVVAENVTGGTASPFKGKGTVLSQQDLAAKGKSGKDVKGGKFQGKGGKGGKRKSSNGEDEEDEDEPFGGKANNGKGICPGAQRSMGDDMYGGDVWYKGKPGVAPGGGKQYVPGQVPFGAMPPVVPGATSTPFSLDDFFGAGSTGSVPNMNAPPKKNGKGTAAAAQTVGATGHPIAPVAAADPNGLGMGCGGGAWGVWPGAAAPPAHAAAPGMGGGKGGAAPGMWTGPGEMAPPVHQWAGPASYHGY